MSYTIYPGHPHATNMYLYAQDAMETESPWKRWQWWNFTRQEWVDCNHHPDWNSARYYHRKPTTVRIEGEVEMEDKDALKELCDSHMFGREQWRAVENILDLIQEE